MRYYFNILEGPREISDSEGTELPDEEAAQVEAGAIALELARIFPGRFGHGSVLETFSECGQRVFALPIPCDLNRM